MKIRMKNGALPALLVAGMGWGILSGCSDTSIVGSVLDQQVQDGGFEIQLALVRGANSEVHDIWTIGDGYGWDVDSATDAMLQTESSSSGRVSVGHWQPVDSNNIWGQAMEGSWSGLKVVNNLMEAPGIDFETSVLVTRGWLNAANSERLIGEAFCNVAYGFNHTGGQDLPNLGPDPDLDNGLAPKDSAFKRMATFAQLAVEQAERSLAAGIENPVNEGVFSDILFDPEFLYTASHSVRAQAHWALAVMGVDPAANWAAALESAAEVPTDFEHHIVFGGAENNDYWVYFWDNDNYTWYSEAAPERPEGFRGFPGTWLWPDDPRTSFTDCTQTGSGCDNEFGEGPEGPTGDGFPLWADNKYPDSESHILQSKGTEMRLIEAEHALVVEQDFETFYDLIDEVRDFYDAGPTQRINVMGDLEWPNAEDDAMSILDRERYLTLLTEGRRLFDLHRWDHPFVTDNHVLIERHEEDFLQGGQRGTCMPMSEEECQINATLAGTAVCSTGS